MSTRMAIAITCYDQIAQLQHINNISIETIEERAHPGDYAESGFLGSGQSFKAVLQQDWKMVEAMETTHIELAAHLKAIWQAVKNIRPLENSFAKFSYDSRLISQHFAYENSEIPKTAKKASSLFANAVVQNLEGRIKFTKGGQTDLFGVLSKWSEDLIIKNPSNNLSLTVAEGVISYIETYGFYEGGRNNPYRVDPFRLVTLLTGKDPCQLRLSFVLPSEHPPTVLSKNEGCEENAEVDSEGRRIYTLEGGAKIFDGTHGFAKIEFIGRGKKSEKPNYQVLIQGKIASSPEYASLIFVGSKTITIDFFRDLIRVVEFDDRGNTCTLYVERESQDDRVECYELNKMHQSEEQKV